MPVERLQPELSLPQDRLRQLGQVIPEAFADGDIDWETLREVLGERLEESDQPGEHFGLSWPGKRQARRAATTPSNATLIPCPGEGVNETTTRNAFIEGENLEVLKLLLKSYAGRVKMIYIDPPYNTGKDFIYPDDYSEPAEAYLRRTGQLGDTGEQLTTSPRTSGRFHSTWLNMMYPRLVLARQFLREDGVIFTSIDDHEVQNLRLLMDELFGEENFLANLCWRTDGNFDNQAKFKRCHEYILVYAKDAEQFPAPPVVDPNTPPDSKLFRAEIRNTIVKNGPKNPVSDVVLPSGFPSELEHGTIEPRSDSWPHYVTPARFEHGRLSAPATVRSGWSSRDLLLDFINNNCEPVLDAKGQKTRFVVSTTGAIEAIKARSDQQSHVITSLTGFGGPQKATSELDQLGVTFGDYPKPTSLIKYFLQMNYGDDFVTLDFFAGSCTTAQAVLALNREDAGTRRFIMVQLPEPTGRDDFPTIAEIGKERIRRVIATMEQEDEGKLDLSSAATPEDLGFRVYRLVGSHFRVWPAPKGDAAEHLQERFAQFERPLREGWEPQNLLVEIMLREGFPLDSTVRRQDQLPHNAVDCISCSYREHQLFVCLDAKIHDATINAINLGNRDVLICLDSALSDEAKLRLLDGGKVHTI